MHKFTQFPKGSFEAQYYYIRYCETVLKKTVHYYNGVIQPYQLKFYNRYEDRFNYLSYQNRPGLDEAVSRLYHEGCFLWQVMTMDYTEFRHILFYGNDYYPYYGRTYRPPMKKQSYRRNPLHSKKKLNEQQLAKQEWRKKKGFTKDFRKKGKQYTGKQNMKKFTHKKQRQFERTSIHHEDYEKLSFSQKNYQFKFPAWDEWF